MDFKEFKKIPRLTRECVVTEKIDGTNGVIAIGEDPPSVWGAGVEFLVGSKTQWITPENDNHGFAKWALENKEELLKLGKGLHYGEWWGQGINRNYGLKEKRFSLFNTARWSDDAVRPKCCLVVPILYTGLFDTLLFDGILATMKEQGSRAVPGWMKPEGIVIYHKAGNLLFKKTLEKDEGKDNALLEGRTQRQQAKTPEKRALQEGEGDGLQEI